MLQSLKLKLILHMNIGISNDMIHTVCLPYTHELMLAIYVYHMEPYTRLDHESNKILKVY